jgi:hypothetical protein
MEFLKIVLLAIVASVVYGILHDQVTARVCVEYFTVGHPDIFHTEDPTLLGLGWGVVATWWVGLLLGLPLAAAARLGSLPEVPARDLVKPVALLMVIAGLLALVAGIVGFLLARQGQVWLVGWLANRVPREKHPAFLADLWTHLASYGFGFLGGLLLVVRTLYVRWKKQAADRRQRPGVPANNLSVDKS